MVSFDPDWQTGTATGTSLSVPAPPAGGAAQVAAIVVGLNGTLTGLSGFTEKSMVYVSPYAAWRVRYYVLTRPQSADPIAFTLSAAVAAVAVVGSFPEGTYELLPPLTSTAVPGESATYLNPQEINNIGAPLRHWVPSPPTTVIAGALFTSTDAGTPTALTLTSPDGAIDVSAAASMTDANSVRLRVNAFAFETTGDDPSELNPSNSLGSERRWITVLGGEPPPGPPSWIDPGPSSVRSYRYE